MEVIFNSGQQDVETFLLRPLTAQEAKYVEGLLHTAWARLLLALPTLPARMQSGAVSQAAVDAVVAEMVANVMEVVSAVGTEVAEGDTIVLLESMKMEIPVLCETSGTVSEVAVALLPLDVNGLLAAERATNS